MGLSMSDNGHDTSTVRKFQHPGRGSRRATAVPKGRQVDPHAKVEIEALLGDRSRQRDLLIEYLHLIQDNYGQISAAHLAALADEMALSFAEVFETATFYAHFDIVKEDDEDVPVLTVRVCDSLTCAMFGAERLLETLQEELGEHVRVVRAPCVGLCDQAPAVEVGHNFLHKATVATVKSAVGHGDTHAHLTDYIDEEQYRAAGGYQTLERLRSGALSIDDILKVLDDASLRGLGGAGFPTGRKWRSVKGEPGPRLMAVNGDEGEPGTFKDQYYLNTDPHRFLEGMLIGAFVVEASDVYIYIRDEYPIALEILANEIPKLPPGGPSSICGAAPEHIYAVRNPRSSNPLRANVGFRATSPLSRFRSASSVARRLINNVETLFWVRDLVEKGAGLVEEPRQKRSTRSAIVLRIRPGKEPGVKFAPAGITIQELIDEFCGGMSEGHSFAAYFPGRSIGRRSFRPR